MRTEEKTILEGQRGKKPERTCPKAWGTV